MEPICDNCGQPHNVSNCPGQRYDLQYTALLEHCNALQAQSIKLTNDILNGSHRHYAYGQLQFVDYVMILVAHPYSLNQVKVFHCTSVCYAKLNDYAHATFHIKRMTTLRYKFIKHQLVDGVTDPNFNTILDKLTRSGFFNNVARPIGDGWFDIEPGRIDDFWDVIINTFN